MWKPRLWIVLPLVWVVLLGCQFRAPAQGEELQSASSGHFSDVWIARDVDAEGRPTEAQETFAVTDPSVFVVAEVQQLSAGDSLFARWSKDGQPYEDSALLTTEGDISAGYVHFFLKPEAGQQFVSGAYSVTIYLNGQPAPETASAFTIGP